MRSRGASGAPTLLPQTLMSRLSVERRLLVSAEQKLCCSSLCISPRSGSAWACYAIHMKRTNVVLDEDLLEEAVRVSGERTYARTIERALEEMVRRARVTGAFQQLIGSGGWSGSLSDMRRDAPVVRERRGIYRPRKRRAAR